MEVKRRTFEAKKHPKGSEERAALNCNALTSEYMTSYRYCLVDDDGKTHRSFVTKAEAEAANG